MEPLVATMIRTPSIARLVLVMALAGSIHAAPQPSVDVADAGRLAFRVYTDRDGLPQNAVRVVATDAKGQLWVGTKDGAAFYDGRTWTPVRLPGGKATDVWSIVPTPDGAVWIATDGGGLGRWRDGAWRVFDTSTGLPSNQIRDLLFQNDAGASELWAGTDNGLAKLTLDGTGEVTATIVESVGAGLGNAVTALVAAPGPDGIPAIWVGLARGLVVGQRGRWTTEGIAPDLRERRVNDFALGGDGEGSPLYVGTNDGLFVLRDGSWSALRPPNVASTPFVRCLARAGGTLWVGTSGGGLLRYADGLWTRFTTANGVPYDAIWSLLVTPAPGGPGTLWVGTGGRGLGRLSPNTWTVLDARTGLAGDSTYAILESKSSASPTLWIGLSRGVSRFRDGTWTTYRPNDQTYLDTLALAETRLPNERPGLWVGCAGGLYLFDDDGRPLRHYTEQNGLPGPVATCLLESEAPDGGRELWVGTRTGIARLRDGVWTRVPEEGPGPNNEVTCLVETRERDGERAVWAGTQRGLRRLRGGVWKPVDLGSSGTTHVKCVFVSDELAGRRLWVGTNGGGVRWRDLEDDAAPWHELTTTTTPALPNDVVYRVFEDAARNVYLTTNRGVARLTPAGPSATEPSDYRLYVYTTDDGLPSNECNTGASLVDGRGRIWVGTIAGAALLDPASRVDDVVPKPLRISKLAVNGALRSLASTMDFGSDETTLEIEYTLLSFFHEGDTRYRTQLVGLEPAPTDWTTDSTRRYTTLPAGRYTFRVWGRDYAGNVTGPVEIGFRVRPAPWATWWAYVLYAMGLVGIGFGAQRWRIARLETRARALNAVVDDRTRQLADANEALRIANLHERERALEAVTHAQQAELQMLRYQLNPHFLFNALNAIRALVTKDPVRGRSMITELAEFLRYSLTTSNASTVALSRELDSVRGYLAIQQIRFGDRLDVRFAVDDEVADQQVPPFLLQPLVENAVKYGSLSGVRPVVVQITARRRSTTTQVWVSNTGRWFAEGERDTSDGTGIGLTNVRLRVRETFGDAGTLRVFARSGWVHAQLVIRDGPRRIGAETGVKHGD